ncbi:MAG: adenylate/guanylate cyclase domain-containing protein [Syntrophorhabdaceae bacterium]|nr:adenylate/guanylate cyclase domain-containing protein [Syntrophorhabdaceae bacterium]MDD5245485.1 adenylate/guanylate cyclase domain-containing protein [Syntrophorhabdaceae bacterium]
MKIGILIIDDEDGIRRSLARLLKEEGYLVQVAGDGEEALEIFGKDPYNFDIVICDLIMPGIDGIKTIEEINKIHQDITKIILTGYGTLESSIKAIEAGIDGFITKPFENKELKWKIKEYYLKRKLKQFIAPDIFNELLREPAQLEPKMTSITILFSDIRGFTDLSARTSPQDLAALLNKYYFHPLSEVIIKHKGTIDKYIGDGIMALFGAPVYQDNHEENAVRCAIEMVQKTEETDRGIRIGIGVCTGSVITGVFGSASKKEYTALGMPVNIAARLQKLATPGEIVISEETRKKLDGSIPFKHVGSLAFAQPFDSVLYYKWIKDGQD